MCGWFISMLSNAKVLIIGQLADRLKMKLCFTLLLCQCLQWSKPAPTSRDGKDLVLMQIPQTRFRPLMPFVNLPYRPQMVPSIAYNPQVRGPLSFIGTWIQNSDWFPIEINVPDVFTGIGSFAQNFGNGFTTFTQNLGTGFNNFAQNFGNGVNNFAQNFGNGVTNFAQNLGNNIRNKTNKIPFFGNAQRPRFPIPSTKIMYYMPVPQVNNIDELRLQGNQQGALDFDPFDSDEDRFSSLPYL